MSELLQIQRALQNYLLDPLALKASVHEARASKTLALDSLILETKSVSREVRLHIYANAYRARIVEALSVDFGMLHAYLGDAEFSDLVHAYIEQHPSRYFSLRGVGSEIANFLRTTPPYADHIELHELAEFEWALCYVFDAIDARRATSDDFSALLPQQWSELTLQFVPALRVLDLYSNAPAIWAALNGEQTPPVVAIATEAQHWLVWRRNLKLLFRPLDALEKLTLNLFLSEATFADVCGELAEQLPEDEVPQRVATILQQWLQDGLIATPLLI